MSMQANYDGLHSEFMLQQTPNSMHTHCRGSTILQAGDYESDKLVIAARRGDVDVIADMVSQGVDLNTGLCLYIYIPEYRNYYVYTVL